MNSDIFKSDWKQGRNKSKRRFLEPIEDNHDRMGDKNRGLLDLVEEEEYDYYPRRPKKK
ncbi:MAG: hypothetical protein ABIB93_03980 [Chloroflexota bacterium]